MVSFRQNDITIFYRPVPQFYFSSCQGPTPSMYHFRGTEVPQAFFFPHLFLKLYRTSNVVSKVLSNESEERSACILIDFSLGWFLVMNKTKNLLKLKLFKINYNNLMVLSIIYFSIIVPIDTLSKSFKNYFLPHVWRPIP